jgi:hypothetical protein
MEKTSKRRGHKYEGWRNETMVGISCGVKQ